MTTIHQNLTIGQIAARMPASIRVFEKYQIDFCCGGGTAFFEACQARGLDPAAVLAEIDAAAARPADESTDWQTAPLDRLIDHIIETHHIYLKAQLPRLEAMIEKVVGTHGSAVPAISEIFGPMKAELEAHLMKEEMILFPMIRAAKPGAIGPIRVMLAEHDSAGEALERLRTVTGGYTVPEGACNTWRGLYFELADLERDLHRHIHLENNILFPRALER